MSIPVVLIALAVLTAVIVATIRTERVLLLQRIRSEWSQPCSRVRKFDLIRESHDARVAATGSASLDDRTWNDLNMDAVFAVLDRTESTLGQHALYHRLRTTPAAGNLDAFDALVRTFMADPGVREPAQMALARLQDPRGYNLWWLSRTDALDTPSWYAVFPLLAASLPIAILLGVWFRQPSIIVAMLAVNTAARFATSKRTSAAAAVFRHLAPVIYAAQDLASLGRDDVDAIVAPIRREGPRLAPLKTVSRWLGGNPLILSADAGWVANATNDLVSIVYEYLNFALLLDANATFFGGRQLRANAPGLLDLMAALGDVDSAVAVASIRAGSTAWTSPHFCPPGTPVSLVDVRHPLVHDAVPNSIRLAPPHGVLITGSNMSGKTTFLRTVGVSAVLAQTIHACQATEYVAPIFTVRSGIGRTDDLEAGKSYYFVEVESLLSLVEASKESSPHLFLLDELFRGTNAVERIAAGEAVLRELVADRDGPTTHIAMAATHDGELVDLLKDCFAAYHFGDAIGDEGLVFDFHLQPGPATTRNAITLLRLQGAPATLVSRALARAEALDRQRTPAPPAA